MKMERQLGGKRGGKGGVSGSGRGVGGSSEERTGGGSETMRKGGRGWLGEVWEVGAKRGAQGRSGGGVNDCEGDRSHQPSRNSRTQWHPVGSRSVWAENSLRIRS